ncbi:hypothetical protein WICMUC_005853, partial [Wickerhamomyces mucosus]
VEDTTEDPEIGELTNKELETIISEEATEYTEDKEPVTYTSEPLEDEESVDMTSPEE